MNNNNLYNTNNFIGITHNDYFKTASNALSTAIINTSNILELHSSNFTSNYANITEINSSNYTKITSNLILARYDPLIKQEKEHLTLPIETDLYHTYIYNSNVVGEIRFWTKSTSSYPVINPFEVPDYRVKIGPNGHLMCYYTYDPLISLTFGNGWIDVATSIVNLNSSDANFVISMTGLEAQMNNYYNLLQSQIIALINALQDYTLMTESQRQQVQTAVVSQAEFVRIGQQNMTNAILSIREAAFTGLPQYLTDGINVITARIVNNPLTSAFLGAAGAAFYFIANKIYEQDYNTNTLGLLTSNIVYMSGITETRRQELLTDIFNEKINSIINITSNEYNINLIQGFINSNITGQQYISSLKCETLDLNTGNITNINGIAANELIANGKIKQNGILLDNTYLTSNHLYNLAYTYTAERQYPSKLYNTTTQQDTVSLLNKLVYHQTLYLNNSGIAYGSGIYEIYSSSTYDTPTTKDRLFNFNTTETTTSPRWAINQYNSGTGNYQADNSIDGTYYGDWVILKLPKEILLSRYRIYQRSDFLTKAPAEWKCYGSKDGITFIEITEASQTTRLTSYTGGFYEKTLASTFTTLYQYIGFTFKSLLSTSGQTDLSFSELQLFGKEILSNTITSNIYTTSNVVKGIIRNEMSDIPKRKQFLVSIPVSSIFVDATSSTTFYKWDLDLRNYTTTQIIPSDPYTGDLLRVFKFSCWYVPSYFGSYINKEPYVINYTIYMSNKSNAIFGRPETAGINIYAVGFPENIKLANILPNNLMLCKNFNSNFNYLTILSRTAPCDLYVIIEDQLF